MARTRRLGLRLARLARARVRRPRRGLVGLASYLGLERLWLGMGPRFMGLGQPVCWCLDRRNCRSSGDRGAAADLCRTAADCCRTSVYLPATDRSGATRCCERAELIVRIPDGQHRWCQLNPSAIREASDWLAFHQRFWNESFDRLDSHLRPTREPTTRLLEDDP